MSFFLNPFSEDFRGNFVLGDRQYSLTFKCPRNAGRGDDIVTSWGTSPFDLSGNDADGNARRYLTILFALQSNPTGWTSLQLDLGTSATTSAADIVTTLNANTAFTGWFTATYNDVSNGVQIRSLSNITSIKFYIKKTGAEEVMKFNARAGVAELPTYFNRDTIAQVNNFADSKGMLILLSPTNSGGSSVIDNALIDHAVDKNGINLGFSSSTVHADYVLLHGQAGIFTFQKLTVDVSDRITQIVEYNAGAVAGDLGRLIKYSYTGAKTNPDQITEQPYTLTTGDLVTP